MLNIEFYKGEIQMTIDEIRMYLEKSPSLLSDIKRIMDYRDLRTQQVYYAKLLSEYRMQDHSWVKVCKTVEYAGEWEKGRWQDKVIQLDKDRRPTHNRALSSFARIVEVGKFNGLPEIYKGKVLSMDEIYRHEGLMERQDMTDAMFDMLFTIENAVLSQEQENKQIQNVQTDMMKFNYQYHVQNSMTRDESTDKDGGVIFDRDLATIFDSFFED